MRVSSLPLNLIEKFSLKKIILLFIVAMAFFFRVYELSTDFLYANTIVIFEGVRLHLLDFFNFEEHFSLNFFKSAFASLTMRNLMGSYVSSTIYGWLGIPLSEFWFRFFYVCVGTFCVAGTYFLGRQLYDYRLGLVGAAILAINSEQILYSRWEGGEIIATFFSVISFIALLYYREHPTWVWRTVFSIILMFVASTECILLLPLILLCQLMLFVPPETSYSKKLVGCYRYLISKENILLWLPCFFILLVHWAVYLRIGHNSSLGLFGHMDMGQRLTDFSDAKEIYVRILNRFLNGLALSFKLYSYYYFNPGFFYSSLAVFFFLVIGRGKSKSSMPPIILIVSFFYLYSIYALFGLSGNPGPHVYIGDTINVLFLGSIWISLFDFLVRKFEGRFARIIPFVLYAGLSLFLVIQAIIECQIVLKRQRLVHPLKSIGYYIHEYGGGNPTAYLLTNCGSRVLHNAEFYFGTQIMDPISSRTSNGLSLANLFSRTENDSPRKLFCAGSKSIEETLSVYKLDDFDFYVDLGERLGGGKGLNIPKRVLQSRVARPVFGGAYIHELPLFWYSQFDSKIHDLRSKGMKRVAVIKNKGLVIGKIYSRRDLPFKEMEIDEYDRLWDQKYANLSGIVKSKWFGLDYYWGYGWDPGTGIPIQSK